MLSTPTGPASTKAVRRTGSSLSPLGPVLTRIALFCKSIFVIYFASDCRLSKSELNKQVFRGNSKTPNSTRSLSGLLCSIYFLNLVSLSNSTWLFHETEANHAYVCLVVDCFRGEIHQSRNAGPPERPQRETQRPLAQSRPLTATQKKSRPAQTQFFIVSRPPKPHEHQPGHDYAQKFDRCILVAAARVGLWGGASPRKKP